MRQAFELVIHSPEANDQRIIWNTEAFTRIRRGIWIKEIQVKAKRHLMDINILEKRRSLDHIAHFPTELGRPRHYWNDAIAMTDCSTRLVLQGQNPYTDFSLADCFARLHMTGKFSTPLRAGVFAHVRIYPTDRAQIRVLEMAGRQHVQHPAEFESYLSYPAGAFLLPAPFYALGWHEMSTFYIAWIVLAYLLLAWWAPWRLRPWLAPLALANLAYWDYAIHGFSEGLVVFPILAGWVTRRRAWLSAVLMGVAIATRQDAWLFALFYAILIGRTCGWRDAARRLAMMVALFGLANGPFVLWSPTAWIIIQPSSSTWLQLA